MDFDAKKNRKFSPKQPYFVLASTRYYKAEVMRYGISHFYSFYNDGSVDTTISAVPDGCVDILFCCDDAAPFASVCGTVLHSQLVNFKKNKYYFGVRFLPGYMLKLKNAKMSDFIEQQVSLSDLLDDREFFERITSSHDFKYQMQLFMDKYLRNNEAYQTENIFEEMREFLIKKIIESKGQIKVSELAKISGYSERYVSKMFNDELGLAPKVFCKLIRFQHLLYNMNEIDKDDNGLNLSELAIELGYYDQSHMIKDFNELSNITPTKYLHLLKKTDYKKRIILV
jgi:AraC-like DNA-binding protein